MAAHRIFNYFGRILIACLAVTALVAAGHHGVVKSNGVPVPGATVTAVQGDKKLINDAYERMGFLESLRASRATFGATAF